MTKRELIEKIMAEAMGQSYVRGNYTVVIIKWQGLEGVGVAKRNPPDVPNQILGYNKAWGRARKDLIGQAWKRELGNLFDHKLDCPVEIHVINPLYFTFEPPLTWDITGLS